VHLGSGRVYVAHTANGNVEVIDGIASAAIPARFRWALTRWSSSTLVLTPTGV